MSLFDFTSMNKKRVEESSKRIVNFIEEYSTYSDFQLSAMANIFRIRLRTGESIEDIKEEALAVCCEVIKRKSKNHYMPYNTQIMAAYIMSDNVIAQMQTGEGKTLVQILSSYLFSLDATKDKDKSNWGSIHILTSNDYLALRDKTDNETIFKALGLSVGYAEPKSASNNPTYKEKKQLAYSCDIVYATPKTVAFDYLDDNHVMSKESKFIKRKMYHAIVDEADDVLVDQSTKPLLLSGNVEGITIKNISQLYRKAGEFIYGLNGTRKEKVDIVICDKDTKENRENTKFKDCIFFRDTGKIFLSDKLSGEIYSNPLFKTEEEKFDFEEAITKILLAKVAYEKGKNYTLTDVGVTNDGKEVKQVTLIDENTSRLQEKTKYRDGMHEAIEVKEYIEAILNGKKIYLKSGKTNAVINKITYPEFMKKYITGVSGMTGTSPREEFKELYGLETYDVPLYKESKRKEYGSEIYRTKSQKYKAIIKQVKECIKLDQPVLIGTTSIKESNEICSLLDSDPEINGNTTLSGKKYQRIDADAVKPNDKVTEDEIFKKSGYPGVITVATNMAGRGVDIQIQDSIKDKGLFVIGVSKNISSRVDRQLIGRCARQGKPGSSKFYQSLDDILVIKRLKDGKMDFFKSYCKQKEEAEAKREGIDISKVSGLIKDKSIIKLVNTCQTIEEGIRSNMRMGKKKIEDKVFRIQRDTMFDIRNQILDSNDLELTEIVENIIKSYSRIIVEDGTLELVEHLIDKSKLKFDEPNLSNQIETLLNNRWNSIKSSVSMSDIKTKMLKSLDEHWSNHLLNMDIIEDNILRSGLVSDPYGEYIKSSNIQFNNMLHYLKNELLTYSLVPELKYGEYQINSEIIEERKNIQMGGKNR